MAPLMQVARGVERLVAETLVARDLRAEIRTLRLDLQVEPPRERHLDVRGVDGAGLPPGAPTRQDVRAAGQRAAQDRWTHAVDAGADAPGQHAHVLGAAACLPSSREDHGHGEDDQADRHQDDHEQLRGHRQLLPPGFVGSERGSASSPVRRAPRCTNWRAAGQSSVESPAHTMPPSTGTKVGVHEIVSPIARMAQPFPGFQANQPVSVDGGIEPRGSCDGREL